MKLRYYLAAALAALSLSSFAGCEGGTPNSPDAGTETAVPQPEIALVTGGVSSYTVLRSDTLKKGAAMDAAVLVRNYAKQCGVEFGITTDWEKNPVSEYEIVIGQTLRTEEQGNTLDPHTLGEQGYAIHVAGSRIYIGGGSEEAIYAGAEAFLREFFGYTGDAEAASPVTEVRIPGGYSLVQPQEYAITSFTVADKPLTDFRIRVDTKSSEDKAQAKILQSRLYSACGAWLEIVEKDETWDGPAIVFSPAAPKTKDSYEISVQGGNLEIRSDVPGGHTRGMKYFFEANITGKTGEIAFPATFAYTVPIGQYVLYSEFGAVGDGKTNDMPAIIAAHNHANIYGIPVKADEGAVYYISNAAAGAVIQTDTDWTGASFIIDDSNVSTAERSVHIFNIPATKSSYALPNPMTSIDRDATNLGVTLPEASIVYLEEAGTTRYIRAGANQNNGSAQSDLILVSPNGDIDPNCPLLWDYTDITTIQVTPMDTETLTVKGGTFTTVANQAESQYNYYNRGIRIGRSHVVIDGVTHYVTGEGDHGAPYSGFMLIQSCANVTIQNCVFTAHKTYKTIGSAGTSVSMGTYDIGPNRALNLTFRNCTQTTSLTDSKLWGIMGSNYCKNMVVDHCEFSRVDAHAGVANVTILDSTVGVHGMSLIGYGTMRAERCTFLSSAIVGLRTDYGSTWEGEFIIKDCVWKPSGTLGSLTMITASNSGQHDFGYDCYMPAKIHISGLTVEDGNHTSSYAGLYLLGNVMPKNTSEAYEASVPYPYHVPETVSLYDITTASGKGWKLSANPFMYRNVEVVEIP